MSGLQSENIAQSPAVAWTQATGTKIIEEMQRKSLERADKYFKWYLTTKREKAKYSKIIRFSCILLFTLTAVVPLVNSFGEAQKVPPNLGYILATFGAGLLFLDRFYGFSTGWVRVNRTLTEIGDSIRNFTFLMQTSIHLNSPDTPQGFQALADTIRTFNDNISAIIKSETSNWEKEFQSGSEELQKYFKDYLTEQKPGDLKITVVNYSTYLSIELFFNDVSKGMILGGAKLFRSLTPENYEIKIKTISTEGGVVLYHTLIATVKPGALEIIEFK